MATQYPPAYKVCFPKSYDGRSVTLSAIDANPPVLRPLFLDVTTSVKTASILCSTPTEFQEAVDRLDEDLILREIIRLRKKGYSIEEIAEMVFQ